MGRRRDIQSERHGGEGDRDGDRETEKERLREGETETKIETWRDIDSLQGERKRDTPSENGTEAERDGVGEMERSTETEREERGGRDQLLPLAPTARSNREWRPVSFTWTVRSAHPGTIRRVGGPHLVPGTPAAHQPSAWHTGRTFLAPRGLTQFFHLPAPRSHLINVDQELPRWSEGPGLVAVPVEAFLSTTVKLLRPLFFIYIRHEGPLTTSPR